MIGICITARDARGGGGSGSGIGEFACLRCRDVSSDYYGKFFGYKHSDTITVDGRTYGIYSYQYREQRSAAEVAGILQRSGHALFNAGRGVIPSNLKVEVKHFPGIHAMDFVYSDQDIVKHVKGMGSINHWDTTTTPETKLPWLDAFEPDSLQDSFFFADASHASMSDTIEGELCGGRSAPTTASGGSL
jgi:hypothetical protein